jgi:glutathione S-transferase
MAHIGPMMGQANVFYRYLDEKVDIAISRYHKECRRLFEVLDNHLSKNEFLTGEFSIADIANWCWVRTYKWSGIDFTDLNHLSRWMKQIYSINGMSEGLDVPISQEDLKKYYESKIGRGGNNIVIK